MEIAQEMVDLHSHILPGIDDGAKNWEIAVEMVRMAA
jgi:protein-tyrosine phosphatase